MKCISTGRKCDGYTIVHRPFEEHEPQLSVRPVGITLIPPSSVPTASTEDIRLLTVFHEQCILVIPGPFHSNVWSTLVPQLGSVQPAVYHTMLAIASIYEEIMLSGKPLDQAAELLTQTCALKQYTTALHELQTHMNSRVPSQTIICVP